jgi:hypothetical protein
MPKLGWTKIFSGIAGLLLLGLGGCESSPDGKEWVASANAQQQITQVTGALDNSEQKVCSGVNPGQFRDTILVPSGWQCGHCQNWAISISATHFQCGKLNPGGITGQFSWCAMDDEFCF